MSEFENKQLPVIKVKVGDQVYVGRHDIEKGIVILEDGRIVRVGNPQPQQPNAGYPSEENKQVPSIPTSATQNENNQPKVSPGIQRPQSALEKMEAKKREMAEREAQKKKKLSRKGPNVSKTKR